MKRKSIGAGTFKAHCLSLIDEVASSGQPLIITKHGRPMAKLVPIDFEVAQPSLKGSVVFEGDIVGPIEPSWDVAQ